MPIRSYDYQIVFGRSYLLPIFEIRLLGPTGVVPVSVMLDSGTEYPVFSRERATQVGIGLPAQPNFRVMYGGSIVPGWRVRTTIAFGEMRVQPDIVFVETLLFSYSLLGRLGVFAHFNEVCFIEKSKTPRIELRW